MTLAKCLNANLKSKNQFKKAVFEILDDVKRIGDQAIQKYTLKFDSFDLTGKNMEVSTKEVNSAMKLIEKEDLKALEVAAERIEDYYKHQKADKVAYKKADVDIKVMNTPLESVGIYVPGGKASYPSTVLMSAIPAKVAGVEEVIMCSPWPNGEQNPAILAAAQICRWLKRFIKWVELRPLLRWLMVQRLSQRSIKSLDPVISMCLGPKNWFMAIAM